MEVIVGKHAGFCFGVKRAVDMLDEMIDDKDRSGKIFTWGPIIHNDIVVRDFEERGVRAVHSMAELIEFSCGEGGTVIIRSHGAPRAVCSEIEENGFRVVDATCPFVKRIHRIVEEAGGQGRYVVIVGDPSHPEVEGIIGWAADPSMVRVCESTEDAQGLDIPAGSSVTVVSQTTYRVTKFKEIVEIIREKEYDANIADTICNATDERQREAEELAKSADAMIVVGGADSSNTRKLYEICSGLCPHTSFVHSPEDLKADLPPGTKRVGITAGASTPQKIIEEVMHYVRAGQEFH